MREVPWCDVAGRDGACVDGAASFAPASHSHLTLGGIFGYLSTNMPADRPGKMKPEDYTDIMAFLLYSNGYRPTTAKLTADVARASTTPLNAGPPQ